MSSQTQQFFGGISIDLISTATVVEASFEGSSLQVL